MEKYVTARSIIRTAVTKLVNKAENLLNNADINIDEINDSIVLLNDKEISLKELNSKIFELTKTEELEKELTSVENYQESILLCRNKLNRAISKLTVNTVQSNVIETNVNSSHASHVSSENGSHMKSNMKLPRLTIASFDGDVCKWNEFWSRFKISIHDNDSLSNVEKFSYLKSYLTKDAEKAISGLLTTDKNYDTAIKTLENRFGRKDLIIDKHMSALLTLAPCRNSKDVGSLRKVYDTCELQINALKGLDIEIDTYGALLFPVLIKALPSDIVISFTREHSSDENKISDLLEFLKIEVESRERAFLLTETRHENNKSGNFVKSYENKSNKFHSFDSKNKDRKQSTASLNVTTEKFCLFCNKLGNHVTDNCECYSVNEKKNLLKQNGRCFSCYKKFHLKRNCRSKIECTQCHSREHRRGLCEKVDSTDKKYPSTDSETIVASVIPGLKKETQHKTILMSTFKSVIVTSKGKFKVRCLLDSGSERTFIHREVCNKLKLPIIGEETINLNTFGNTDTIKLVRSKVQFKLCNVDDANKAVMIEALESPEICGAFIEAPSKEFIKQIQALNIKLSDSVEYDDDPQRIDILVGSDFFWKIVTGKTKRLSPSLVLIETLMGWAVQGPVSQTPLMTESTSVNVLNAIMSKGIEDDNLTSTYIKSFWQLESIGIENESSKRPIPEDEVYQNLKSNLNFKDNRYEVKLPWKYDSINLNDNYFNAQKRLNSLICRFKKDSNLYTDYKKVIDEYLKLGIVEVVEDENDKTGIPVYYLPHHPVIRKDKDTTKLRIVFDGSSHPPNSPSLNELLHPGPNLNPDLLNLLLRFRLNFIAFIADIEKAFLMISLDERDRDAVRFLWVDDLPEHLSEMRLKVLRMKRVLFGVTSSPFLLAGVIKLHLDKYFHIYPETCNMLNDSMYVDDLLSGASNEEAAFKKCKEAKLIMDEAGMTLRKWKSNSSKLENLWENSEIEFGSKEMQYQDKAVLLKVLGLIWDRYKDTFKFDVTSLIQFIKHSDKTKRTIIQSAGRIFDPTGFLSPFTMRLKLLFQELWEKGIHWDEELPDDINRQWETWCEELPLVNCLEIPRYYFGITLLENLKSIQIHCFSDSSEIAYGSVIYLRFTNINNDSDVTFLMSKGRLAPLKKLTIPRLELTAALIGARLISHIKPVFQNLSIDVSYHCWTDSSIALCWIKGSSSKWKPYVANRVREIQSLTDPEIWRHCPGQTNPADIITRKRKLLELINCDLWWSGPQWLREEENWPKATHTDPDSSTLELESRKAQISLLTSVKETLSTQQYECIMQEKEDWPQQENEDNINGKNLEYRKAYEIYQFEDTIDKADEIFKRYSSWSKLRRVMALCLRFIRNCRNPPEKRFKGFLTSNELKSARNLIVKIVQKQTFSNEIKQLEKQIPLAANSKILSLNPFLDDDGLIRVGGRLALANIPSERKHPIILPKDNYVTRMIITHYHEVFLHAGTTLLLAVIRREFWIIHARSVIKHQIWKCVKCHRLRARTSTQIMANLPSSRVIPSRVFSKTGVDYAGPFLVKPRSGRGVRAEKFYICIFVCFVVKAIHIELVGNLSTESFIAALKRFVARRGKPSELFSDCGSNFVAANKELKRLVKVLQQQEPIHQYLAEEGIKWHFNPPSAPHFGGIWESAVKSAKSHLKRTIGSQKLTQEEFLTLITQVEACLNSRPLCPLTDDPLELSPLTPGHFLVGTSLSSLPEENLMSKNVSVLQRWKLTQQLFQSFWKRWSSEYLSNLQNRPKWCKMKPDVKINDLVLIKEDNLPPLQWKLGRVINVYPSSDGKIRVVNIKTATGSFKRPIHKLSILPLND